MAHTAKVVYGSQHNTFLLGGMSKETPQEALESLLGVSGCALAGLGHLKPVGQKVSTIDGGGIFTNLQ